MRTPGWHMLVDSGAANARERLQPIASAIGERLREPVVVHLTEDVPGALAASPGAPLFGWLAPVAALRERGIDAAPYFEAVESAPLDRGVLAMVGGDGDYAVTYDRALRKLVDSGQLQPSDFSVAWASQPLPYDALAVSPGLELELRERLRAAVLSVGSAEEVGRMPTGFTGFSYAQARDYEAVRRLTEGDT